MGDSDQFFLKSNNFHEKTGRAFHFFKEGNDFTDVTLVSEDYQEIEVHKIVLAASSSFFLRLLKKINRSHPLIYLRGVTSDNLVHVVDFLYQGEVNVLEDHFENFMQLAQELELEGLVLTDGALKDNISKLNSPCNSQTRRSGLKEIVEMREERVIEAPKVRKVTGELVPSFTKSGNHLRDDPNKINLKNDIEQKVSVVAEHLDEKIRTLVVASKNKDNKFLLHACFLCGKEGKIHYIKVHIEANRIESMSNPCDQCDKTMKTRDALRQHKYKFHNT